VVLLVTDFLFSPVAATIATTMTALLFLYLWYVMPLRRRMKVEAARGDSSPARRAPADQNM
jgi:hypothetical protein